MPYPKGKPQSKESNIKRSIAAKGIKKPPRSKNHCKNQSIAQKKRLLLHGKNPKWTTQGMHWKLSEETRQKQREARKRVSEIKGWGWKTKLRDKIEQLPEYKKWRSTFF